MISSAELIATANVTIVFNFRDGVTFMLATMIEYYHYGADK